MLNDTKLWKAARTTWHHVLIAGMLKDYELKKKFAMVNLLNIVTISVYYFGHLNFNFTYHSCILQILQLFSKNYADMMKDFINDDHDHPFSITSLSVQIFTVPTIAHFLIEHHDVIFTIMRTLMSECEQKLNTGMSKHDILRSWLYTASEENIEGWLKLT